MSLQARLFYKEYDYPIALSTVVDSWGGKACLCIHPSLTLSALELFICSSRSIKRKLEPKKHRLHAILNSLEPVRGLEW